MVEHYRVPAGLKVGVKVGVRYELCMYIYVYKYLLQYILNIFFIERQSLEAYNWYIKHKTLYLREIVSLLHQE